MIITTTRVQVRERVHALRGGGKRIALVPTMGCLHEGHLSLIRTARELSDVVVVSIYVNPMQFGPTEDFEAYPRTFEEDCELCQQEGVELLFHPENLYPEDGIKASLKVEKLGDCLCGKARPGHFDGVATVVNILFNIVQPDIAIFGEKDWQQFAIIRRMAADLHMPVEVISAPTVREADGLAMSSRNRYLDHEGRRISKELYSSLNVIYRFFNDGETHTDRLEQAGRDYLHRYGIEPEYLEIRHAEHMHHIDRLDGGPARAFIAARVGAARLIDNIALETS